jgi:hypothetical protein
VQFLKRGVEMITVRGVRSGGRKGVGERDEELTRLRCAASCPFNSPRQSNKFRREECILSDFFSRDAGQYYLSEVVFYERYFGSYL